MARYARNFATRLSASMGITVDLQDERLSSFEAEQRLGDTRRRGRKRSRPSTRWQQPSFSRVGSKRINRVPKGPSTS